MNINKAKAVSTKSCENLQKMPSDIFDLTTDIQCKLNRLTQLSNSLLSDINGCSHPVNDDKSGSDLTSRLSRIDLDAGTVINILESVSTAISHNRKDVEGS